MASTFSFTVDNVSGSRIIPQSTCRRIVIYEAHEFATDDLTFQLSGGSFVFRQRGSRIEIGSDAIQYFTAGVAIGTIKRASAGTLTLNQEEF